MFVDYVKVSEIQQCGNKPDKCRCHSQGAVGEALGNDCPPTWQALTDD